MFRARPGRSTRSHPPIRGDEDLTQLAARAAAGDRAAEEAFVARTIDDVWRYCRHLMGPAHADDATQATYLRALRSLGNFRGESSAKTWLIGVARNTCLDLRRTLARRARLDEHLRAQPQAVSDDLHAERVVVDRLLNQRPRRRGSRGVLEHDRRVQHEAVAHLLAGPHPVAVDELLLGHARQVQLRSGLDRGLLCGRGGLDLDWGASA